MYCLIVFKSVTYAQRGDNALSRQGMYVAMVRTQAILGGGSCSYGLKVRDVPPEKITSILDKNKIPYSKVFVTDKNGRYVEY